MVAFVLPVSVYAQVRKDVASLSDAADWQGYVSSISPPNRCSDSAHYAAARFLVRNFHDNALKKSSARPRGAPADSQSDGKNSAPALKTTTEARPPGSFPSTSKENATVSVETSLVLVPISVLDREGRAIPDLKHSDFHVFEDNVEQQINHLSPMEVPFSVALLLDTSSSMRLQDDYVRQAAAAFMGNLKPVDRVMIVSFNSEVWTNAEFTSDRFQLGDAVHQTGTGAGTRLYDAVDLVLTERLREIGGRKAIVLFTDGVDTESRLSRAKRTLELAEESGALIYTIQCETADDSVQPLFASVGNRVTDLDSNRSNASFVGAEAYRLAAQYLRELADRTGARMYTAATISSLNEAFSTIASELRQQYELSYYPANKARDGSFRRIHVQVDRPDVAVRARPGYRAARDTSSPENSPERRNRS